VVNLNGQYVVSLVNIKFYNAADYLIEGSNNGSTWIQIANGSAKLNPNISSPVAPGAYSYIRINITSVATSDYCSIYEINIYNTLPDPLSMDRLQSSASNALVLNLLNNVGIGTMNTGSYKLAVEGKIGCREINVLAGPFPDYVFENDYNLLPLNAVEAYIKENKHLPDVPSANVIAENGMNLGEMNLILMKKVEELTLYLIDLKHANDKLQRTNEELRKQNTELSERILKLEKK